MTTPNIRYYRRADAAHYVRQTWEIPCSSSGSPSSPSSAAGRFFARLAASRSICRRTSTPGLKAARCATPLDLGRGHRPSKCPRHQNPRLAKSLHAYTSPNRRPSMPSTETRFASGASLACQPIDKGRPTCSVRNRQRFPRRPPGGQTHGCLARSIAAPCRKPRRPAGDIEYLRWINAKVGRVTASVPTANVRRPACRRRPAGRFSADDARPPRCTRNA